MLAPALVLAAAAAAQAPRGGMADAGIAEMRAAMESGKVSSRQLVTQCLIRIALYDRKLRATITVNPRALDVAAERDRERAAGKVRGPLHGVPIALKDNIHTTDMPTTGGALAFEGFVPPYEATLTTLLREAGAVIVAKTSMTELANWVASGMPNNYNAISGFGMNPYDPRRDPRADRDGRPALNPGGSSSGIGTAAGFWAANVGTETSGSILGPANQNMLVGIKPTVGRVSRYGVIPITADQDTAGPLAKTVEDAAILLGAMEGASPDPRDPATARCAPPPGRDYTRFLRVGALRGARIGIPRAYWYEPVTPPGSDRPRGGLNPAQRELMSEAIAILKKQGAVIVDPADLPSVTTTDEPRSLLRWGICAGAGSAKGKDAGCSTVFKYGMKRDFNRWLESLGPPAPVASLTALREFNLAHRAAGAIRYGQAQLDISDEMDVERDRARYEEDRAKDIALNATWGIDAVMKEHRLDALLFPGASGYSVAATPGYPTVIVPFGSIPNRASPPFPEGFDARPAPYGISFAGLPCSEPRLLALAYAFEQATKRRVPPVLE